MLEKIQQPVREEMERFNRLLTESYTSENHYISDILRYVLQQRGKQLRSLLVMLSAALHGRISERTMNGAILVEMTHTASLLHDDVVDEAYMRRGKLSVNAIWRSKTAVLAGDYVLSRALRVAAAANAFDLLSIIIGSFEELSEGELIQLEHASKLDMTEPLYFDIIGKKTASLLSTCGAIGARSAGAGEQSIENMKRFGKYLGMAFQIRDDILDFESTEKTGKPTCTDLKERKITLPVLRLLEVSEPNVKKEILRKISTVREYPEHIAEIRDRVLASDAMEYSEKKMKELEESALAILDGYPQNEITESLRLYARYILERKR